MYLMILQTAMHVVTNKGCQVLDFIAKLPLTELLVGVVVPIVAACISFALADRATRRKEYNRLFIQIELLRKELLNSRNSILKFISKYNEKRKLEKELEFPLVFCKELLINVLNELEKIKSEYFYFNNDMLYEKPSCLIILNQEIEELETKIDTEEFKFYEDEYLEAKQKRIISKLKEQKEQCIAEYKKNQERSIYKEFLHIQSFIERNTIENLFKNNKEDENFIIMKYIYHSIKEFNSKENKSKTDVAFMYERLVLFKISQNVIEDGQFKQDEFDLNYKAFEKHEGIEKSLFDICEKFYKLIAVDKYIKNYKFDISNQKWCDNSSDLVLLSDSDLYISISELYEEIPEFLNSYEEEKDNTEFYKYSQRINQTITDIIEKLEKHKKKIEKWCK